MSRGHGRRQRQLLVQLRRYEIVARELGFPTWCALTVFAGEQPSRADVESLRRAARTLAKEGLVLLRLGESGHLEACLSVDADRSGPMPQHLPWRASS